MLSKILTVLIIYFFFHFLKFFSYEFFLNLLLCEDFFPKVIIRKNYLETNI